MKELERRAILDLDSACCVNLGRCPVLCFRTCTATDRTGDHRVAGTQRGSLSWHRHGPPEVKGHSWLGDGGVFREQAGQRPPAVSFPSHRCTCPRSQSTLQEDEGVSVSENRLPLCPVGAEDLGGRPWEGTTGPEWLGGGEVGQMQGRCRTGVHKHPPALPLGKCPQIRAPEPAQLVRHLHGSFLSRANTGVSWGWGWRWGWGWGQGLGKKRPWGLGPWTISHLPTLFPHP